MLDAPQYLITVVELGAFTREAEGLFSAAEVEGLVAYLANHPDEGSVIPDTGGVRKIRWRARGKGKRAGARVIYFFRDLNMPLYLLTVYGKGEKLNLTMREKKHMRGIVDQLVKEQWRGPVAARVVRIIRQGS